MTRKDYAMIAKAISDGQFIDCMSVDDLVVLKAVQIKIAEQLAGEMSKANPRFDRARFLVACGVASATGETK